MLAIFGWYSQLQLSRLWRVHLATLAWNKADTDTQHKQEEMEREPGCY